MSETLYKALCEYISNDISSFHTPGHKGRNIINENLWGLDLTELPDTDSLYEAKGIILKSERLAQKLFNTKRTIISSGGNTLCIQTMIRLATMSKRRIISGRNVHRSAVSAMSLLGVQPTWVLPDTNKLSIFPGRITAKRVANELDKNGGLSAVYITSPDYYGILSDIKNISSECQKRNALLLVDNAHGTHLKFLTKSLHPIDLGATMSADSAHKTLPVLTGGAWLHISDINIAKHAKQAMALFGSTSPSYPIMASLDVCREYLENNGDQEFIKLTKRVREIKKISENKGLFMPTGLCDPTRISWKVSSIGYDGQNFTKYLKKYKIEPEFFNKDYVVLIPSPFNSEMDWNRIENAIENIEPISDRVVAQRDPSFGYSNLLPKVNMTLTEAIMGECVRINVDSCLGRTAGEIVCPCPPGIPVIMPGEIIGEYERDALKNYGILEIDVVK